MHNQSNGSGFAVLYGATQDMLLLVHFNVYAKTDTSCSVA
jgi:hypothetical protein